MGVSRFGSVLVPLLLLVLVGVAECHFHHGHEHGGHGHGGHGHREGEVEHPVVALGRRELRDVGVSRLTRVASLTDEAGPWNEFKALLDAQVGDVRTGLSSLKSYLLQFGYINATYAPAPGTTFTNIFDNMTQSAITMYQRSFGLTVTGRLDVATLTQMIIPRCGREDVINGTLLMLQNGLSPNMTTNQHLGVAHYSSFPGSPRWKKKNLTYAIDSTALSPQVSLVDTEIAIDTAFATWASAITLSFTRIPSLTAADITISFDSLDHGDGNAFDGQFGVLAHAFAPSDGRLHFDQQESWSLNVNRPSSLGDFDLLSVAVHEIGHILGLEHSAVPDAVMYPSISALEVKRSLGADDIAGAQALYGANTDPSNGSPPGTGLGNQGNAATASVSVNFVTLGALTALAFLFTRS